jgi:hypothetical protein
MANQFHFDKLLENLKQMKSTLPAQLANDTQNFFLASFKKQGWDNTGLQRWKEVQRRIPGTRSYKYPKNKDLGRHTRAILQGKGSGVLRKAVASSIRSTSFSRIILEVSVPYATYLNSGTKNMPARKFMGDSISLRKIQRKRIVNTIDRLWRQ